MSSVIAVIAVCEAEDDIRILKEASKAKGLRGYDHSIPVISSGDKVWIWDHRLSPQDHHGYKIGVAFLCKSHENYKEILSLIGNREHVFATSIFSWPPDHLLEMNTKDALDLLNLSPPRVSYESKEKKAVFSSIELENFRTHAFVKLSDLGRINVLLGKNNSGKTAFLEAIFLLLTANPREVLISLNELRGYSAGADVSEIWNSVFYNWDSTKKTYIRGTEIQGEREYILQIAPLTGSPQRNEQKGVLTGLEFQKTTKGLIFSYKTPFKTFNREITSLTKKPGRRTDDEPEVGLPVTYLSARGSYNSIEEAKRFSKLQLLNKTTDVVDALKLVDSRLVNLLVIATEKGSAIYGDIQTGHFSPIPLMGDGMVRVLSIALSLTTSTGGVMLLDEVENGIYYEVMPKIWKMIANTARKLNVQLFVTTHSEECIRAVHQALEELKFLDDLRFYRFESLKGNTGVVCYDPNEINAALKADIEVR